jgi:hypothetical protein
MAVCFSIVRKGEEPEREGASQKSQPFYFPTSLFPYSICKSKSLGLTHTQQRELYQEVWSLGAF